MWWLRNLQKICDFFFNSEDVINAVYRPIFLGYLLYFFYFFNIVSVENVIYGIYIILKWCGMVI